MMQASKYNLEQQYDIVFACACIHNINIIRNGQTDQIFDQANADSTNSLFHNQEVIDPPPTGVYSSDCKREECENW